MIIDLFVLLLQTAQATAQRDENFTTHWYLKVEFNGKYNFVKLFFMIMYFL